MKIAGAAALLLAFAGNSCYVSSFHNAALLSRKNYKLVVVGNRNADAASTASSSTTAAHMFGSSYLDNLAPNVQGKLIRSPRSGS
jgi:hypothetical protein